MNVDLYADIICPWCYIGELRQFHEARRKRRRRPCGPGQLFCMRCRAPRGPALGLVEFQPKSAKTINAVAFCEWCEAPMNRVLRLGDAEKFREAIAALLRKGSGT